MDSEVNEISMGHVRSVLPFTCMPKRAGPAPLFGGVDIAQICYANEAAFTKRRLTER
jgi:hypothetical protein